MRKVYHFRGLAETFPIFSVFYRLRDTVESFMDYEGLFSHRFHLVLDESKQTRDATELNDSEKRQTFYWNRLDHYKKGHQESHVTADIQPFSQDTLSALYYLRSILIQDTEVLKFPVVSEGKTWDCVARLVGREQRESALGPKKTMKIKLETQFQGVIQQKNGDSFLWLSDDTERLPLRLEAKVRVGTVVAELMETSGRSFK